MTLDLYRAGHSYEDIAELLGIEGDPTRVVPTILLNHHGGADSFLYSTAAA